MDELFDRIVAAYEYFLEDSPYCATCPYRKDGEDDCGAGCQEMMYADIKRLREYLGNRKE